VAQHSSLRIVWHMLYMCCKQSHDNTIFDVSAASHLTAELQSILLDAWSMAGGYGTVPLTHERGREGG